jgi:type I restriction-modification system DNA methylase subunit
MAICAFGQNPIVRKSYEEDLYLETIAKYKDHTLRHNFPKMVACLTIEMEERLGSSLGNDVLGECYELNFGKKGLSQFFTPWPVCEFIASTLGAKDPAKKQRIIDPCCGSGRLLLCGAKRLGRGNSYYGIDVDHTCVKMASINLFLNGVFQSEIMWADALMPGDFRMSYKISFLPFGIYRISVKEDSYLWHAYMSTFDNQQTASHSDKTFSPEAGSHFSSDGSQLKLF